MSEPLVTTYVELRGDGSKLEADVQKSVTQVQKDLEVKLAVKASKESVKQLEGVFAQLSAAAKIPAVANNPIQSADLKKDIAGVVSELTVAQNEYDRLTASIKKNTAATVTNEKAQRTQFATGFRSNLLNVARDAGKGAGLGELAAFAGKAGAVGLGITATYQAVQQLQEAIKVTGEDAETTTGRMRNFGASLLSGDVVGAIKAAGNASDTLNASEQALLETNPKLQESFNRTFGAAQIGTQILKDLAKQADALGTSEGVLSNALKGVSPENLTAIQSRIAALAPGQDTKVIGNAAQAFLRQQQLTRDQVRATKFQLELARTQRDVAPKFALPGADGLLKSGNLDILHRKVAIVGKDLATVRSIGIEIDNKHFLLPTIINGKAVSNDAAIAHFKKTGENLGQFKSEAASEAYGDRLHRQQEQFYSKSSESDILMSRKKFLTDQIASLEEQGADSAQAQARLVTLYGQLGDVDDKLTTLRKEALAKQVAALQAQAALAFTRIDIQAANARTTGQEISAIQADSATASKYAKDKHFTQQQRLQFELQAAQDDKQVFSIRQQIAAQAAADAKEAARIAAEEKKRQEEKLKRQQAAAKQLRELRLSNAEAKAGLTKSTADDKKAIQASISYYKNLVKNTTGLEREQARSDLIGARGRLKGLKSGSTASVGDFFKEVLSDFRTFGSNFSSNGSPLSPQAARGAFSAAALGKAGGKTVEHALAEESSRTSKAQLAEQRRQTALLSSIATAVTKAGTLGGVKKAKVPHGSMDSAILGAGLLHGA